MVLLTVFILIGFIVVRSLYVGTKKNQADILAQNVYSQLALLKVEDEYLLHVLQFANNLENHCYQFMENHKELSLYTPHKIAIYYFSGLHFIRKLKKLGKNDLEMEYLLKEYHQDICKYPVGEEKSEEAFKSMKTVIEESDEEYYHKISPADSYTWGALAINDIFRLKYADYILGNKASPNYLDFKEISQKNALEFHAGVMSLIDSFYKNLDEAKSRSRAYL